MKSANPKMLDKLKDKFTTLKEELVGLSKALPPVKPPVAPPVAAPATPAPATPAPATPVAAPAAPVKAGPSSDIANKFVPSKPVSSLEAAKMERARQQRVKEITYITASGQTSTSPRATGDFKADTQFGNTASGKSIMHGFEGQHDHFSAEEHADAARQFMQARNQAKMDPKINKKTLEHFTNQVQFHDKRMRDLKAAGPTPMTSRTYNPPTKG